MLGEWTVPTLAATFAILPIVWIQKTLQPRLIVHAAVLFAADALGAQLAPFGFLLSAVLAVTSGSVCIARATSGRSLGVAIIAALAAGGIAPLLRVEEVHFGATCALFASSLSLCSRLHSDRLLGTNRRLIEERLFLGATMLQATWNLRCRAIATCLAFVVLAFLSLSVVLQFAVGGPWIPRAANPVLGVFLSFLAVTLAALVHLLLSSFEPMEFTEEGARSITVFRPDTSAQTSARPAVYDERPDRAHEGGFAEID